MKRKKKKHNQQKIKGKREGKEQRGISQATPLERRGQRGRCSRSRREEREEEGEGEGCSGKRGSSKVDSNINLLSVCATAAQEHRLVIKEG